MSHQAALAYPAMEPLSRATVSLALGELMYQEWNLVPPPALFSEMPTCRSASFRSCSAETCRTVSGAFTVFGASAAARLRPVSSAEAAWAARVVPATAWATTRPPKAKALRWFFGASRSRCIDIDKGILLLPSRLPG